MGIEADIAEIKELFITKFRDLNNEITALKKQNLTRNQSPETLIAQKDAMNILGGICRKTIVKLRNEGKLPFVNQLGKIYYYQKDLDAYIKENYSNKNSKTKMHETK